MKKILLFLYVLIVFFHSSCEKKQYHSNDEIALVSVVDSLNSLSFSLCKSNSEKSISLANEGIKLSESINYFSGIACGNNNLGVAYKYTKDYEKSLSYYKKALAIRKEINETLNVANTYKNIGFLYYKQENWSGSINAFKNAIEIYTEKNDNSSLAELKLNVGIVYGKLSQIDSAIITYKEMYPILDASPDEHMLSKVNQNLGLSFAQNGNFAESLTYIFESLKYKEKFGSDKEVIFTLANIARIYKLMENYINSKEFFQKALSRAKSKQIENDFLLSPIYADFANVYKRMDMVDSCIFYLNMAFKKGEASGNKMVIRNTLISLANVYSEQRDFKKAIEYRKQAKVYMLKSPNLRSLSILTKDLSKEYLMKKDYGNTIINANEFINLSNEMNNQHYLMTGYELLYEANKGLGNYQVALNFLEMQNEIKDTLLGKDIANEIEEIKTKYQTEKKEAQLTQAELENKAQLAVLKTQKIGLFSMATVLLLALGFLSFIYKQNRKIRSQKTKIDNLFRELHHRVKNNLQSLVSIMNLQSKSLEDDAAKDAILASKGRVQAMGMIHQKMLYQNSEVAHVDIAEYVESLLDELVDIFEEVLSSVDYKVVADKIDVKLDIAVSIALIINELVTNSFKYAFEDDVKEPSLIVRLIEEGDRLHLTIKDNGKGIPEGFDINKSNSFGMQIVQMFTQQIEGSLKFSNEDGARYDLFVENYQIG